MMDVATRQAYNSAINEMIKRGKEWLATHPNADVRAHWNFPARAFVVAVFDDAVSAGLVNLSGDAPELCRVMQGTDNGVSLMMMRAALESLGTPEAEKEQSER